VRLARILGWTLVLSFSWQCAHAALCERTDTRQACENRYTDRANKVAQNLVKEAGQESVTANTGNGNAVSPLPTSAFTDFFNLLQTSAATGEGGADDPEALAFELNHCGMPAVPDRRFACQIRGRAQKPKLYDPLKKALEAADLATQATDLDNGLDVTDQVTAGIFISRVGDKWGSGLSPVSIALYNDLKKEAESIAATTTGVVNAGAFNAEITRWLQDNLKNHPRRDEFAPNISNAALTFEELVPPDLVDPLLAQYEKFAEANVALTSARFQALREVGSRELARLINQQPQLYAGIEYSSMSEFAGQDGLRAKITYETGFANVNRYRQYARRHCTGIDGVSPCLLKYLAEPGVKASLESGNRLAVTIEHVRHRRYDVSIPDTAIALSVPSSRSWIGSLALGRYLNSFAEDQKTRVDVVASWEDVSDDPARQDRGIATATVSRQLSGDWVLAVGLVYATKPEFRAEADKDLSLRLGLNYKLLRPTTQ
jgi:hypothetical protein